MSSVEIDRAIVVDAASWKPSPDSIDHFSAFGTSAAEPVPSFMTVFQLNTTILVFSQQQSRLTWCIIQERQRCTPLP
ncbi:hypothetical protein [Nostoc sp.]|uniref:hypothetical protein n=1 Tax=Nostoc sp. TaxID=1180 RepID=UPI002FF7DC06